MHSPDRLTLPLMVQSGEGATDPDADASRMALAFSGGLTDPRIAVFLLRKRQSLLHQPFLNVLAVDLASGHQTAAPVDDLTAAADPGLVVGVLDQFVARGGAAGPALAVGVEAELIDRGCIDAAEPDAGVADQDMVALADFGNAGDVGGLRKRRQQRDRNRRQEFHAHAGAIFKGESERTSRDSGADLIRAPARGRPPAFNLTRDVRPQPSSPAKAGDPVFQGAGDRSQRCGVLGTPLSRGMTANLGAARNLN